MLGLSGCTPSPQDYGYFTFLNTAWGMTPDEVFESLDLNIDDFTVRNGYLSSTTRDYMGKMTLWGNKVEVGFSFHLIAIEKSWEERKSYLDMFPDEKFDVLWEKLLPKIEEQGVPISDPVFKEGKQTIFIDEIDWDYLNQHKQKARPKSSGF